MGSRIKPVKRKDNSGIKGLPKWLMSSTISIYIFMMLGVFPLWYNTWQTDATSRYSGDPKYGFYHDLTLVTMIALIIMLPIYTIAIHKEITLKKLLGKISLPDCFIFAYIIVAIISFIVSDYKEVAFWGINGWNMGILAQLGFVLIYFFVSRFWKWDSLQIIISLIVATCVFTIAILHRFSIDPFGLYKWRTPGTYIYYLSTMGQATWYSSYLCAVFPLGLFFFWHCKGKISRAFATIVTTISFATLVTQNSDSAFIALILVFMVFLWFSMESNEKWKRFLEMVIVMLTTFRIIGTLQLIFKKQAVKLDAFSIFASQHILILVALVAVLIIYFVTCKQEAKGTLDIPRFIIIRKIMIWAAIIVVIGMVALIVMNTKGMLGKTFSGYLLFDRNWGNGRGFTWAYSANMFKELTPLHKIFGVGPDCFAAYSNEFHAEYVATMWGGSTLPNAHNEWLNSLLCYGIVGAIAYIGFFIAIVKRFFMNAGKKPILIAIGACILSYMGHNLFCYQQCICTPTIFILMGIGEYIVRTDEFDDKLSFLGNKK